MQRKIIQIAPAAGVGSGQYISNLYALADDGSAWVMEADPHENSDKWKWSQVPALPDSEESKPDVTEWNAFTLPTVHITDDRYESLFSNKEKTIGVAIHPTLGVSKGSVLCLVSPSYSTPLRAVVLDVTVAKDFLSNQNSIVAAVMLEGDS